MKGFVSLEYILLMASVVAILCGVVTGIIVLYNRNISAIDNARLSDFCKELKSTIEMFEIMPEGKDVLEPRALTVWQVEKSGKVIEIKNKNKSCQVTTSLSLVCGIAEITEKQKVTIVKQNNALNII